MDGFLGTFRLLFHTTERPASGPDLEAVEFASTTPPSAPGRIARICPLDQPVLTKTRPCPAKGRALPEWFWRSSTRHSSRPVSGSYPYTALAPWLINVTLPARSATCGVE